MTPSPFQLAQAIGNRVSEGLQGRRDRFALEDILNQAQQAGSPQDFNTLMSSILQNVSPQQQGAALQLLQSQQQQLQNQAAQEQKGRTLEQLGIDPRIAGLDPSLQKEFLQRQSQAKESQILAKVARGEELSPEEQASLSPATHRSLLQAGQEQFEKESDKLEAKRVSEFSTEVEKDFRASQDETQRLQRMEKLIDKGNLTTPLLKKSLDALGLPLGVLGNPDSEEFSKLEADFLRDVRNVFPGGRITNYEIQSYLRTVPTLLNTDAGKRAVIRNRKFLNEAKNIRYEAYKEILKENKGRKPPNLPVLLEERTSEKLKDIESSFLEGIQSEISKTQQPIRMIDPQGRPVNIPPDQIERAQKAGAKFA